MTKLTSSHAIMSDNKSSKTKERLYHLSLQLKELVALCEHLREENAILRDQQANLAEERALLIEKNEMARTRVEAMISRLKAMENSQ